jgi:hypothetical protein
MDKDILIKASDLAQDLAVCWLVCIGENFWENEGVQMPNIVSFIVLVA